MIEPATLNKKQIFIALSIYLIATLIFLHPLPFHLADRICENGDAYLHLWIFSWEAHTLFHSPADFWNGNIFYPEGNSLALSELVLPIVPIFAVFRLITGNPLIAYNTTLLLSFPLSALSMLALVFYLTRRFPAALIAGFIYGFTPVRLAHTFRVQNEYMIWLPLLFLFFHLWLKRGRWRDALIVSALFALQYLTTVYTALYLIPILLIWYVLHFALSKRLPVRRNLLQGLSAVGIAILMLTPFILKYSQLSEWHVQPSEELKIKLSSDLWWNFFSMVDTNFLYGKLLHNFTQHPYDRFYFSGFIVVLLALFSLRRKTDRNVLVMYVVAAAGFIFALGPFLQISRHVTEIPLPYHWIYDSFRGLEMLRAPSRFGFIMIAALTVLSAYGWMALAEKIRISTSKFSAITLLLLGAEFFSAPIFLLPLASGDRIPQAYAYLQKSGDVGGVLELPTHAYSTVSSQGPTGFTDRIYTYYAAYHFKPIVVGYSGYFPPTFNALIDETAKLPSNDSLDLFEAIGVRTIVLHTKDDKGSQLLDAAQMQLWNDAIANGRRLAVLARFDDGSEVLTLKPTLNISKDLNSLNWIAGAGAPDAGVIPITLQSNGIRSGNADYVVNPQIPLVGSTRVRATWRDIQHRIVKEQTLQIRLRYLLNRARVQIPLKSPKLPGSYTLELTILESPPLALSAVVLIAPEMQN
jgi:hypothetical protein